jgi:hypothetical protein
MGIPPFYWTNHFAEYVQRVLIELILGGILKIANAIKRKNTFKNATIIKNEE